MYPAESHLVPTLSCGEIAVSKLGWCEVRCTVYFVFEEIQGESIRIERLEEELEHFEEQTTAQHKCEDDYMTC
jgi:hypothetical protein